MSNKNIKNVATEVTAPIVEKMGLDLIDIDYVKEGRRWYLRIFIDKPGGVTLDDCQAVSEELGDELDAIDPIKHEYTLEVSSPGLERPLKKAKDFERYKGETIKIKLFSPVNGKKNFEGRLLGLIDENVAIELEDKRIIKFKINEIALAKRTIEF